MTNDNPPVIVLIVTYRRLKLALETIKSVKANLVYPNIGFHIADDGSGSGYAKRLAQEIGPTYSISVSDSARAGVGKNMNLGIAACLKRADLWLHLEDDWVLRQPLDLTPCVKVLADCPQAGAVRLGRLSPGIQATTVSLAGQIWWGLRRGSDPYVFSGNPMLRHRRFYAAYGPYREDLTPGQTELSYCHQFNSTSVGPDILWPAFLSTEQMFYHIGDSHSYKWWVESGGKSAEEAAAIFEAMDAADLYHPAQGSVS